MGADPASKRTPYKSAQPIHHVSARQLVLELLGTRSRIAPAVLESEWPDNLMALAHKNEEDLAHLLDLTSSAARRLAAAFELHRRLTEWSVPSRLTIKKPEDAVPALMPLCNYDHERFWLLPLNVRCELIAAPVQIHQGDVDGVDAGPRAFFRIALRMGAASAIAVHNHPSGDLTLSAADVEVTKRLVLAGRAVDDPLVGSLERDARPALV